MNGKVTRTLDVIFSGLAIVGLSPILTLVACVLRITGEKEVFYVQQRVGLNGKHFGLIKFATMLKKSPEMGTGTITVKNDPRVLPFGKILRKTKINELPQLLNVLRGDMSLIGPRPLTQGNFNMYPIVAREVISSVRPGLSGIGSIMFRDEEALLDQGADSAGLYRTEIAPYKADLECWYVANQGLATYFKCIVLTVWMLVIPSSSILSRSFQGLPEPKGETLRRVRGLD